MKSSRCFHEHATQNLSSIVYMSNRAAPFGLAVFDYVFEKFYCNSMYVKKIFLIYCMDEMFLYLVRITIAMYLKNLFLK